MSIDCLNPLIKDHNNIVKYPVLGLYLQRPEDFINYYLVIEEDINISICKRDGSEIINIEKTSDDLLFYYDIENYKSKNSKSKIFAIGNFEVYKKSIEV